MNKRQLSVQKEFVKNEKAVIRELKHLYSQSLAEINDKIRVLMASDQTQSKIYQLEYQLSLRQQISDVLDKMRSNNYNTISAYLNDCYKEGFAGFMFDIQGQGIPLAFPISQNQAIKAVQLDSKISKGLYKNMQLSLEEIKKKIADEIARGISTSASFQQIARNLELITGIDYNKTLRIIRTEGHRIQNTASLDAMKKAVSCGADIVKQWDSTLDGNTRPTHRELDGQIAGVDDAFIIPSTGASAMTAGGFNNPAEDCNCRCCVLQRASWNINDYNATKMDSLSGLLHEFKESDYKSFKTAYFNAVGL